MIVSKTPLRASLFGGGTDFKKYFENTKYGYGSVISTSLDMYVYIIVSKRFDDKIRIVYNGNELVDSVDEIKHNIIREALKITKIEKGIEIVYLANLPMTNLGIGLASSSALAVGVLNALHFYKNEKVSREQLAREACEIEIERIGQQIGIQDQFATSYGGFKCYKFNKNGTVDIEELTFDEDLKEKFMLFYTGSTRDSKQIFDEQNKKTTSDIQIFDSILEIEQEALKCIKEKNFDQIGYLLDKAWQVKKKFAKGISNSEIDQMYNAALKSGALGGKILGAGGGGFLLLYVPLEKQESVKKGLCNYKQIDFKIENDGSQIVYYD